MCPTNGCCHDEFLIQVLPSFCARFADGPSCFAECSNHLTRIADDTYRRLPLFRSGMFLVVGVAVFYYFIYITFSRLLVSPISHIPGPRLAALTFWYEFYFDVVLKGRYTWKIQELHKKYGANTHLRFRRES